MNKNYVLSRPHLFVLSMFAFHILAVLGVTSLCLDWSLVTSCIPETPASYPSSVKGLA